MKHCSMLCDSLDWRGIWERIDTCVAEGNGNPPQYSCLENPMDGGAW